ncbi:hypothetical protein, partial [Brevibacillus porteri]|uniref:hypothetical protein n=1 Tax=Brevibacillus porteri TaxID=2126350 RepID=UPI003D192B4D
MSSVTAEKNISRRSDLWSPTEWRRDERAKETQRARATKRLPLLRFPVNPFGAGSVNPQQDGAWS